MRLRNKYRAGDGSRHIQTNYFPERVLRDVSNTINVTPIHETPSKKSLALPLSKSRSCVEHNFVQPEFVSTSLSKYCSVPCIAQSPARLSNAPKTFIGDVLFNYDGVECRHISRAATHKVCANFKAGDCSPLVIVLFIHHLHRLPDGSYHS